MAVIKCTKCDQKLRIPDDKRGVATCPKCSAPNYVGVNAYQHIVQGKGGRLNAVEAGLSSKSWYLIRIIVLSCTLGALVYLSLNNSIISDYTQSRDSAFNALLETPNTNSLAVNELDSLSPAACLSEKPQNVLTKTQTINLFDEQSFKESSFDTDGDLLLPVPETPAPRREIILLAAAFFVAGIFLSRSKIGAKYKDFCLVYPAVFLIIIGGSWVSTHFLSSKANETKELDYYNTTLLPAEKIFTLFIPWLYETSPIDDLNNRYIYTRIIELLRNGNSKSAITFANARTNTELEVVIQIAHYTHAIES